MRLAAWCVVGLLAVWALAWLAVPPWLRGQLERVGAEQLGRSVTVGEIAFRPWSLQLHVRDVAVGRADAPGADPKALPQMELRHLYIDMQWQSLWHLAPVVDAVEVEGLRLRLAQTSPGHYDIDDIVNRWAARPPAAEPSEPPRFALYNIALRDGAVELDDRVAGQRHSLRNAELAIPFLSNLPAYREVKVAPRLSFELNGSPFDSDAVATPFMDDQHAQVRLQVAGFDLAPFAGYLPAGLPVRLASGRLDADLRLEFTRAAVPLVQLQGTVGLQQVALVDDGGRDVAAFDALKIALADLQPLKKAVHLRSLEWSGLRAQLRRGPDGNFELLRSGPGDAPERVIPGPSPAAKRVEGGAPSWTVRLDEAALRGSRMDWTDASTGGEPARLAVRNLELRGSRIAWPLRQPLQFQGSAQVLGGDTRKAAAQVAFSGEAGAQRASAAVSVRQLPLELAEPYLRGVFTPRVQGTADADFGVAWNGPAKVAKVARLAVSDLALACAQQVGCPSLQQSGVARGSGARVADVRRLEVGDALIDLPWRRLSVGRLVLDQPQVAAVRGPEGRWMFEEWTARGAVAAAPRSPGVDAGTPPWSVQIAEAVVQDGAVGLRDRAGARPVSVNLSAVQIRARDLLPLAQQAAASPVTLSVRVGTGRTEPGRIQYDGAVGWAPIALQGRLQASHVPLHAFEPYFGEGLNVRVVRAEGSFTGQVSHRADATAGAQTEVRGDVSLDEVRVRSPILVAGDGKGSEPVAAGSSEELMNWKTLGLRGLHVVQAAGKPLQVDVQETALSDFFARVIVQESGRINLQDIRKAAAQGEGATVPVSGPPVPPAGPGSDPVIRFGPITLTNGSVRFTDHFVKPNYSTDLSGLTGRLGAFSSQAPAEGAPPLADLELRGRAEGTASIDIVGKLNPLAKPLALDVQGRMRDLELPPLSPYSVKYAGHGIERGKLSMDVTYRVLPDGRLTASNKLVLNQLAFGEPVEGAPASLPVRLAVALLADRHGVIDVDLPISGSLNDPEFSLGSVILRVIGNLVMKAITAPFSLLAGAMGGADEAATVEFSAGSAELGPQAQQQLDKVAQSLADRPALQMTVVGEARLALEQDAWKRGRLQEQVRAQKRRQMRGAVPLPEAAAAAAAAAADAQPTVTAQEYPALLREVYRRADMRKPRNWVGMAQNVPDAEMEALLLANVPVPDTAMRDLAVARAVAVRDYLAERQVPLGRLFVGAPRTGPESDGWTPRAELSLATR